MKLIPLLFFLGLTTLHGQSYPFEHLRDLPEDDPGVVYGDRIRRTMHLLSTSTAERPNRVKILFFGQSITRQNYSRKIIEEQLRQEFPHAQLEVLNTAIGGYQAPKSLLVMHHTLIPHQPDLVVFHVYGGENDGTYEDIVRNIRAHTSAELITITHHLDTYGDEVDASRESASQLRRDLAETWASESVEVRGNWRRYMEMHELERSDFLTDNIHLNAHGGELWGALQARHFRVLPASESDWTDVVTRVVPGADGKLDEIGESFRLPFDGVRVDVISREGTGRVSVKVDGREPSGILENWAATLPTSTPIDYRPAINRVRLRGEPVAETWTLKVDSCNEDGSEYTYSVRGSVSGDQGSGDQSTAFQSANGIIEIQPEWFAIQQAIRIKKTALPVPFEVSWDVFPTGPDEWNARPDEDNPSGQTTLVQQLNPGEHVLELELLEGEVSLDEFLVFRPQTGK